MLSDNSYNSIYRSHFCNFDEDFMIPSYLESVLLERGSGYFSLHSLTLSFDGILPFLQNGGRICLICNPELSNNDIALIDAGMNLPPEQVIQNMSKIIDSEALGEEETTQMDVICNMIFEGRLEIKIAYMPLGIYHEKFGIFFDSNNNMVYFNGSNNETTSGKLYNIESFIVHKSWDGHYEDIQGEHRYFQKLWNNEVEGIQVLDFPEALKKQLFISYRRSENLQESIDCYKKKKQEKQKILERKELFQYQREAIEQFCKNKFNHFYEMATGTGKTFTSIRTISALEGRINTNLFTVICVPQIDLQVQWRDALKADGYESVFLLGGVAVADTDSNLNKAIISYFADSKNVICVAVYDTFFSRVYSRIGNVENLFMIVDEAHNLTNNQLKKMPQNCPFRLGLSATVQRYNQEEAKNIVDYFTRGQISPFYYGIEDAIENGFLSHYEYYPIYVNLSNDEFSVFQSKTKRLAVEYNKLPKDRDQDVINALSRERSLIIKQASNKLEKLKEMTEGDYSFKNSVVYCGAGKEQGENRIIDMVTSILNAAQYKVSQYTSSTKDRVDVLKNFEQGFFDTLVAIKCFDEGVDVPKLDKIYIMASDASQRQSVQRRGRVLRRCKETNKELAYIFDMIVLPPYCRSKETSADSLVKPKIRNYHPIHD